MFDTFADLPLHAIVVHATVVAVPVTAVVVLLAALWPRFRRWAGVLPAVLGLLALALTPLSTQSGEALEGRVGENSAVERHASLGEGLLPWTIALAAVGLVLAWVWWRERAARAAAGPEAGAPRLAGVPGGRLVALTVAAAALVTSVGAGIQVVEVGHTGAQAVWQDTIANTQPGQADDDD
ncbi:DUF2231 domain-containing protein [Actinotalea fermentans]|uniref:DUF2231 domain-containing protein n=1 Tax=Actinotalea fermentans TaxID=43671 RepID=A0A511YTS2_9CELL|nr:DUF2231 domain-containing protein [Actinotalea fermentans]KGM17738.1 hypothetical protein N867_13615 [Actinotalea fermentans ATCC 43279 = JCM 9966 = DSM 3133]GEN78593.1 hypothetical protein AFE02nite_03270 [Actinotalea fermentans]